MRNFLGCPKSSERNQPLRFTGAAVGLKSSTASTSGGSVRVSPSLTRRLGVKGGSGSGSPGEPSSPPLGRHCSFVSQACHGASSSTATREKPAPAVIRYHSS